MEESVRLEKQKELIECIGRRHEQEGFQPVTARILGLLMVMDKEEYTFDEIVREMNISKSAASTALKNLEIRGAVEYITYPGDRKRYFRVVAEEADEMARDFEKKLLEAIKIINKIIELKKDKHSRNALYLAKIARGLDFLKHRIGDIIAEYKKELQ